ncbi:MAG: hypothetical protein H0V10_06045 [Geodermatophilaceae bacterium]|nr:hypothetical protein [Geodermatophilaceae bacterium]
MTTNTMNTRPDIAVAAVSRIGAPDAVQMFREKSALGTAARTHVVSGFGADLRISPAVLGFPPRGVPV